MEHLKLFLFGTFFFFQFTLITANVGYFNAYDDRNTLTAGEVCNNAGGRLAIIDDQTKFSEAASVSQNSGKHWIIVGLHCSSMDSSCSTSPSKWTWYDSRNNNKDLCDISVGGMDDTSLYQSWDIWNKDPGPGEHCVEFYHGKLVLEVCEVMKISSSNAALCQPLSYNINSCAGYTTPTTTTTTTAPTTTTTTTTAPTTTTTTKTTAPTTTTKTTTKTTAPTTTTTTTTTSKTSTTSTTIDNSGYFNAYDDSGTLTAGEVCNNAGGRLAIIDSQTKFKEASSVASSSGKNWVIVGLHCSSMDSSCSTSPSKWTWYDSRNNNKDLCDISVGGMDDLSLYQSWDRWNKNPDPGEHCVEFYGGKFVLEVCENMKISSANAALCQPLSKSIDSCAGKDYNLNSFDSDRESDTIKTVLICVFTIIGVCALVIGCIYYQFFYREKKETDAKKASFIEYEGVPTQNINRTDVVLSANNKNNENNENNENEKIINWMESTVGFPQYINNFISNGYNSFQIIMDITDKSELDDIGITLKGHQTRIIKQIAVLRNDMTQTVVPGQSVSTSTNHIDAIQTDWHSKSLTNWTKNDVLQWICSINLSEKWMESVVMVIENKQLNGNNFVNMDCKKQVGELLNLNNPMLTNRIWRELKKIKGTDNGVPTQSNIILDIHV